MEERELDVHRHGRAHALHVDLVRVQALGLEEELVAVLVREAQDLRLDGRAVARADALDDAVRHRRAVHVVPQDLVRPLVRIGQITRHLLARRDVGQEREVPRLLVAGLQLHLVVVERPRIDARGRARLEAHEAHAGRRERLGKVHRRPLAVRPAAVGVLADDDAAFEIRACRHDDSRRAVDLARLDEDARDAFLRSKSVGSCSCNIALRGAARYGSREVFEEQVGDEELLDVEVRRVLAGLLHRELVELLVGLRAQRVDGGALAGIQHTELDARPVCIDAHLPAERVDLAHEMAFRRPADGRIARHQRDVVHRERRQERPAAHPRRRERRLDPRMPRADHDHIIRSCYKLHRHPPTKKARSPERT